MYIFERLKQHNTPNKLATQRPYKMQSRNNPAIIRSFHKKEMKNKSADEQGQIMKQESDWTEQQQGDDNVPWFRILHACIYIYIDRF